ncbi:hypothetical protein D3C79_1005700 [compost metagenome]
MVIEGAFGGLVEFSGIGLVRGGRIGVRGIRCDLEHGETPGELELPPFAAKRKRVATVRGFADQDSRNPAGPKASHAQLP